MFPPKGTRIAQGKVIRGPSVQVIGNRPPTAKDTDTKKSMRTAPKEERAVGRPRLRRLDVSLRRRAPAHRVPWSRNERRTRSTEKIDRKEEKTTRRRKQPTGEHGQIPRGAQCVHYSRGGETRGTLHFVVHSPLSTIKGTRLEEI